MRAADWRLANSSLLATLGLLVIGGIGYLTNREIRATALAERLLDADTGNVTSVLHAIEPYQSSVMSRVDKATAPLDNPIAMQRHHYMSLLQSSMNRPSMLLTFSKLSMALRIVI